MKKKKKDLTYNFDYPPKQPSFDDSKGF